MSVLLCPQQKRDGKREKRDQRAKARQFWRCILASGTEAASAKNQLRFMSLSFHHRRMCDG
jgi:hypothetical protein